MLGFYVSKGLRSMLWIYCPWGALALCNPFTYDHKGWAALGFRWRPCFFYRAFKEL